MKRGKGKPQQPAPAEEEKIRTEMSQTRAALSHKLGVLQSRLFGTPSPAPVQETEDRTMAKSNTKSGTAKSSKAKTGTARAAKAKTKTAAKGKTPAKSAAKTMAKSAPKVAAGGAKSAARKVTKSTTPRGGAKKTPRKSTSRGGTKKKGVNKAKEVLGEALAGAAVGALMGAAQAIAGDGQGTKPSESQQKIAPAPASPGSSQPAASSANPPGNP